MADVLSSKLQSFSWLQIWVDSALIILPLLFCLTIEIFSTFKSSQVGEPGAKFAPSKTRNFNVCLCCKPASSCEALPIFSAALCTHEPRASCYQPSSRSSNSERDVWVTKAGAGTCTTAPNYPIQRLMSPPEVFCMLCFYICPNSHIIMLFKYPTVIA